MGNLSWFWIVIGLTVPPIVAGAIAYPIWRGGQSIFGNIAGSIVIFGAAIGLMMREHLELDALTKACLARSVTCWPEPSAFVRMAIYAFIALVQVIVLFSVSLRVETNLRNRDYAPEWR